MPTVPGLIPTAEPSTQGISEVGVSVDANAFGAGVGHAVASLGPVLEQAGDRIWQRAVEMQNLENETHAKNADSQFMLESAKMRADFVNKEGVNAGPAALKQHLDDLTKLRTDIRGGLTNPMAQKMYDSSSVSFMGREAFSAAAHSGQQMKVAANQADDARIASFHNDTANNPDDDDQFQKNTRAAAAAIEDKGRRLGQTPEVIKDIQRDDISAQITARAVAFARQGKIDKAEDLMTRARKQDLLTTQDADRADNIVRNQRNVIGSANIATDEYNSGVVEGSQTRSLKEIQDAALAKAEEKYPGDNIFAEHVRRETQNIYSNGIRMERDARWTNKQTVDATMLAGADTMQKLLADPQASKAYYALPPSVQKTIKQDVDRRTDVRSFATAIGQSYDTDPDVRAKFMDTARQDFGPMDDSQWNRVLQRRDAILKSKNRDEDPRVWRAMHQLQGAMGGQLAALGVYRRDTKDEFKEQDYHYFVGTLHAALEDWQQQHGKPASEEDVVKKIAPLIIQQQTAKHWFSADTQEPAFVQPPEGFVKSMALARVNAGQPVPSAEEARREYVRFQLKQLYGAKKKSSGEDVSSSSPTPIFADPTVASHLTADPNKNSASMKELGGVGVVFYGPDGKRYRTVKGKSSGE